MGRIVAIANQKGGVAKTTTAINLAAGICGHGKRVLLVDLDPQGNATTGCGIDKTEANSGVYEVLTDTMSVKDASITSTATGFDVLTANQHLAGAEIELVGSAGREVRLKTALNKVIGEYDFILIDCPPALSLLTINGLTAAHFVIIPMQCEYYALEGLSDLVDTIKRIKSHLNPELEIGGLVRTMFDGRNSLSQQVSEQLNIHFGHKLFETVIPRNVRVAEAPSHGLPVLTYDKQSKGALAYGALSREFLARFG
ncbi:MAG: ParA family protein [Betaproteobacteria bacterium]|nr:ParA family protein [Betaproteobacteria bacterium]MBT5671337.1 ParA family protein [Betaproteobacteria bacterium]MBT7426955.1 ParA family protein [Betaproteobacteria bacterium]